MGDWSYGIRLSLLAFSIAWVRRFQKQQNGHTCAIQNRLFIFCQLFKTHDLNNNIKVRYFTSLIYRRLLVLLKFEVIGNIQLVKSLQKSLNPVTAYKIPGVRKHIENAENWNINDSPRK